MIGSSQRRHDCANATIPASPTIAASNRLTTLTIRYRFPMKSLAAAALLLAALTAHGQSAGNVQKTLSDEAARLQAWGSDPAIIAAVKAQNAKRVSEAQIKALDEQ